MIVLLTGASGGIGQILTDFLLNKGFTVAAQVHKGSLPERERLHVFSANLENAGAREQLMKDIERSVGNPDVFIHNAGVNINAMSWKYSHEDWNKIMEVNVNAAFHLSSLMIPSMREKKFGRIVYVSSVVAFQGVVGTAPYAASKAALLGLMRAQSAELAGKNITVNAVAPGYLNAGMIHQVPEEMQLQIKQKIPMGFFGNPEEMAAFIGFLLLEDARYITGQTLHFNGGLFG